jgi:hypothetical protein
MKILVDFPPNYQTIKEILDVSDKTIVFTYGDTIYVPFKKRSIPDHVKVHESVHQKQQCGAPAVWWANYLVDKYFRLNQEVEAYRVQYRYFISKNHNLKEQREFLGKIADDLSGKMYGNIISREAAISMIVK